LSPGVNTIFCTFEDDLEFEEFYDIDSDPEQLFNLAFNMESWKRESLREKMEEMKVCQGETCRT